MGTKFNASKLKEYMKILGIEYGHTLDYIKKIHRKNAMKHHPDRNHGCIMESEMKMKQINEAYEYLKKYYDLYISIDLQVHQYDMLNIKTNFKIPIYILVDTNVTQRGNNIDCINIGLDFFTEKIKGNDMLNKRVDLNIISFDGNRQNGLNFNKLETSRDLGLEKGLNILLDNLEKNKQYYIKKAINIFQPLVIFILYENKYLDLTISTKRIKWLIENDKISLFPIFFGNNYDKELLRTISYNGLPTQVCDGNFEAIFESIFQKMYKIII